jgi:hypothetical protein
MDSYQSLVQSDTAFSTSNFPKKICLSKHLPDPFAVQNGLRRMNASSPPLLNIFLEKSMRIRKG